MVTVTGIMRGAAGAAITTVGTEAADIIMDGTRADIADGIHNVKAAPETGGLDYIACSSMSENSLVNHHAPRSSVAAARAAAVRPPSVVSPRSAHLRIFLAI
jgi:hypothetical protein